MFACFHVKPFFLGYISWYYNTINRPKCQLACSLGTSHLLRLCINHFPMVSKAQLEQQSNALCLHSPLYKFSDGADRTSRTPRFYALEKLQLNGHLHDRGKSGAALKIPKFWTKSKLLSPFCTQLSSLTSQKQCQCTRIACIRKDTNYKGSAPAQGVARGRSRQVATREGKRTPFLVLSCLHWKACLHGKNWSHWSPNLWVSGKLREGQNGKIQSKYCRTVSHGRCCY